MILIIDKVLILIITLNKKKDKKCPKKDGQKMTDNQKVLGVTRRFKIVEPIYYIRPV